VLGLWARRVGGAGSEEEEEEEGGGGGGGLTWEQDDVRV
jgi:hypothetical protein